MPIAARLPKLPVRDPLIAAVALSQSLTVVTRDLVPVEAAGRPVTDAEIQRDATELLGGAFAGFCGASA